MSEQDDRGFDWASPRWRDDLDEPQATPSEVERDRRFRDPQVPAQRGAIDGPSVGPPGDSADQPAGQSSGAGGTAAGSGTGGGRGKRPRRPRGGSRRD